MIRDRRLHDPDTGKSWGTRCEGPDVVIVSGSPGKEREVRKAQANANAALRYAEKEELARLRKGFVLVDPQPAPGSPAMLRMLDAAYTGAMPVAALHGRALCARNTADGMDLVFVGEDAQVETVVALPGGVLAWKLVHMPACGRVLLLADHGVLALDPAGRKLEALVAQNRPPASFLSASGTRAAWFADPEVVVHDFAVGADVFRMAAEPELYSGHSLQMEGALSADGNTLAVCSRTGEIVLSDLEGGAGARTITGDFLMISRMHFLPGQRLLAKEKYGRWTLHCFDTASASPDAAWPAQGDLGNADTAVSADGRRLAVANRSQVMVHCSATMQVQAELRVDHVAKRADIAWLDDDRIVVRTDMGCVGLYRVPAAARSG